MQTERGKPDYQLPDDFGGVIDAMIDDQVKCGHLMMLMFLTYDEMAALLAKSEGHMGVPVYASIGEGRLWLMPTPDAAYNVVARYEPQPKQF